MTSTRPVNRIGQITVRSITSLPGRPVRTIERLNPSGRIQDVCGRMVKLYGNAQTWASFSNISVMIDLKVKPKAATT